MNNSKSKQKDHESTNGDVNANGITKEKTPLEKELENISNLLMSLSNPNASHRNNGFVLPEMEMQLLEKKSLCLLKSKKYDRAAEECYRILGKKGPSAVVYKCLIVALCRTGKVSVRQSKLLIDILWLSDVIILQLQYDDVRETISQWGKLCPKDPVVSASKEKVERLLLAVRSGMEPSEVFANLEQVLGIASESSWK